MPAQTPHGYSYPLDTDPLSQLAQMLLTFAGQVDQNVRRRRVGRHAGRTNANGQLVVPHNLGVAPAYFSAHIIGTSIYSCHMVGVGGTNDATVVIRTVNAANSPLTANTDVIVQWEAIA